MSHAAPMLLHVFPSFAVGGAQVRFAALANRFGPRWRHSVLALDGNAACAERVAPDVPLRLLASPLEAGMGLARRLLRITRMLDALRPALLVTSNWGSVEWAMANLALPRLPHLHLEDGFGPEERQRQLPRRVLVRSLFLRRSQIVLPSLTLERVAREQWHLPERRLRLIPNGIDLRHFHPRSAPLAIDVPGKGPLIGTAAALRPEKNIGRLLRAVALLHGRGAPARLLIVGDGPERPRLEGLAAELGIAGSTHFLGHMADPASAYLAMDLFCLSSDTEQMPFSLLEAMASGLAVCSTRVGDVSSMLPPESRLHVASLDDHSLAEALRPLVLDRQLRACLGSANRAKVERDYDQEAMFQAHAGVIEALLRA